jgi:hypothetical protein
MASGLKGGGLTRAVHGEAAAVPAAGLGDEPGVPAPAGSKWARGGSPDVALEAAAAAVSPKGKKTAKAAQPISTTFLRNMCILSRTAGARPYRKIEEIGP